jgi:hypothetical protein
MMNRRSLMTILASSPLGFLMPKARDSGNLTIEEKHALLLRLDALIQFIDLEGKWYVRSKVGFVTLELSYPKKYPTLTCYPKHRLNVHSAIQSGMGGIFATKEEAIEATFEKFTNMPDHCYLLLNCHTGGGPLRWNGYSWEISDIEKHKAAALKFFKDEIRDEITDFHMFINGRLEEA